MVTRGAKPTNEEYDEIIGYLLRHAGLVNVNKATSEDISYILGLPDKDGEAIVAFREKHGRFENFDALTKTPGIDAKPLLAARTRIQF